MLIMFSAEMLENKEENENPLWYPLVMLVIAALSHPPPYRIIKYSLFIVYIL